LASPLTYERKDSILPEDLHRHATLVDQREPQRPKTVRARHAASLLVWREAGDTTEILMGMRGARHRFMPNRLVFPGGAVDRADLSAPLATGLSHRTEAALRRNANEKLAHGLGVAAARELLEETGLSLGSPPALDGLEYLARAVTPADSPIRFNARFFCVHGSRVTGSLGGDGELDNLRYYGITEALALDLAGPTRRMLEQLKTWLTLSEAERDERTHVPVLKERGWRLE
jgi:8-oxo-dGTP pyrophosphatase MutT (NUDIX family)